MTESHPLVILARRAIERYVENPLSNKVLSGDFSDGDTVVVDLEDDHLTFNIKMAKVSA